MLSVFVGRPAFASQLPGQYVGSDRLRTYFQLVAWTRDDNGGGWPGPVNSQYILSQDGKYQFFAQADGNLVIYADGGATWALQHEGPGFVDARGCLENFYLGELRAHGPRASYILKTAFLVMQSDGNLVFYLEAQGTGITGMNDHALCPTWNSQTAGHDFTNPYLVMQNDGNLVIRTAAGTPLWWVSMPNSGFVQVG
jgi:hypothetical protein